MHAHRHTCEYTPGHTGTGPEPTRHSCGYPFSIVHWHAQYTNTHIHHTHRHRVTVCTFLAHMCSQMQSNTPIHTQVAQE
jgi:hypothetical protein